MKKKRILLVNPSSIHQIYRDTNVKVGTPHSPSLTLAVLAAPLLAAGHQVRILDLDLHREIDAVLKDTLKEYEPALVALTSVTPTYGQILRLAEIVKSVRRDITTVAGGVHVTTFLEEAATHPAIDIAVGGEADFLLAEIASADAAADLSSIKGLAMKDGRTVSKSQASPLIDDLDSTPLPAWELYDLTKYKGERLAERRSPSGYLETSRGCPFQCVYCNKSVYGNTLRMKSIGRVIDDIRLMLRTGFREIHVVDDGFTTDLARAKRICEAILKEDLKFVWSLFNGVRVDSVDREFFLLAKKAGCWQVAFGIESGNQGILNRAKKKITLERIRDAVRWAKEAGLETWGFFMLGLPGETVATIKDTIEFSKSLGLGLAKYDITIPYPGTEMFAEWDRNGYLRSKDWSKYNCHNIDTVLYEMPDLKWEDLRRLYKQAFRAFYFRPSFVFDRFLKDLRNGNLFSDIKYLVTAKW